MRKNIRKTNFTLIEILVSMGVFLVLLSLLLSFFSGTRQVWKSLRERNEAFENSRVAMNLIADLLTTSVASRDKIGFFLTDGGKSCTFYTHTSRKLDDPETDHCDLDNLYAVKIEREAAKGELVIYSKRVKGMAAPASWSTAPSVTENKKVIIPAVSEVSFKALLAAARSNRPPVLEVTLSMFDNKENYAHWYELQGKEETKAMAKEFRLAHEYSFSRVISFEDVEKPIYEVEDEAPATP